MELKRPHVTEIIQRIVPPLAVWAIGALIERPSVRHAVDQLDRKIDKGQRRAVRNAAANRVWMVAGVAAIAGGIALIAMASTKKK